MTIWSRRVGVVAAFAAVALGVSVTALWLSSGQKLDDVHADIAASYPSVAHMSPDELVMLDAETLLIFDTREPDEFAVSHLQGAIQIAPDLPAEDFLADYGDDVAGKTVLFYCSVGARSTQFADKVQAALRESGAADVANLERGLFGWHNDGREMLNEEGKVTDLIHPYDDFWGRLVDRQDLVASRP